MAHDEKFEMDMRGGRITNLTRETSMTAKLHQDFVERFTALFNEPNLDIADEIFVPGFKSHLPLAPELTRDGWKAFVQGFYTGFPDLRMEVQEVIETVDRAVLRVTYHGTHNGEFQGVPATGKSVAMTGIGIFEIRNGRAVENWAEINVIELMQQIGAIPTPSTG